MKQEFRHKDIFLVVKTNVLKDGHAYFDVNVQEKFEDAYRQVMYGAPPTLTPEQILINIYDRLIDSDIKPVEIRFENLIHDGSKMTIG